MLKSTCPSIRLVLCPLVAGLLVEGRTTLVWVPELGSVLIDKVLYKHRCLDRCKCCHWLALTKHWGTHSRSPHFIWIASGTANLEGECFVGYRSEVSCFSIHCWTLLGKRVAWLMTVVPNWISSYFCHKTHMKSSAVILYDRLWLGKWDLISKTLVRSIYSPCTTEWWWFL